jgi:hypothetical protein
MQPQQENRFKKGIWDKEGSTFVQRILFANNHEMLGYSRKIGFHERNDKDSLLINWILRMYRDGYLDPTNTNKDKIQFIEYYQNTRPDLTLIFRLHYDYPEWNPAFFGNKRLVSFINRFYLLIEKKTPVQEIYRTLYVRSHASETDPLDLSTMRFINERHLSTYCTKLIADGKRPQGEVEHFFHQYKQKFLAK